MLKEFKLSKNETSDVPKWARPDREPLRPQNVLIVDDDIDSAMLIDSIFAHLGCATIYSQSPGEAKKKICSHKADIIILDWVLDQHTNGGGVVAECEKIFSRFKGDPAEAQRSRPKIITYSSLEPSEIEMHSSPYFIYLGHWKKPIAQRDLLEKALMVLKEQGL